MLAPFAETVAGPCAAQLEERTGRDGKVAFLRSVPLGPAAQAALVLPTPHIRP